MHENQYLKVDAYVFDLENSDRAGEHAMKFFKAEQFSAAAISKPRDKIKQFEADHLEKERLEAKKDLEWYIQASREAIQESADATSLEAANKFIDETVIWMIRNYWTAQTAEYRTQKDEMISFIGKL